MDANNLLENYLAHHGLRINLAHVIAPVLLLDAVDVKQPRLLVIVAHPEPRHTGNHKFVNS